MLLFQASDKVLSSCRHLHLNIGTPKSAHRKSQFREKKYPPKNLKKIGGLTGREKKRVAKGTRENSEQSATPEIAPKASPKIFPKMFPKIFPKKMVMK